MNVPDARLSKTCVDGAERVKLDVVDSALCFRFDDVISHERWRGLGSRRRALPISIRERLTMISAVTRGHVSMAKKHERIIDDVAA